MMLGFLSLLVAVVAGAEQCADGTVVLVASATANTAKTAVADLSAMGIAVRALVRNPESDGAKALAALPGVTLVQGDFDDDASITKALDGVQRAILVSDAFAYTQFDRETGFLLLAKKAGLEAVVRISTASFLIHPATTGAYGRAHYGIEQYADWHHIPVVNIRSDWFLSNWLASASEVSATSQISYPVEAASGKFHALDPRDVGGAAAFIAALPSDQLKLMIEEKMVEVHGPVAVNFAEIAAALSTSCGHEITVNTVPGDAWQQVVESTGMPRTFARSFRNTIEEICGERLKYAAQPAATSPLLTKLGWSPKYDLAAWANQDFIKGAFSKAS